MQWNLAMRQSFWHDDLRMRPEASTGHISAPDCVGLSSFIFVLLAPKDVRFVQ